MRTHSPQKTPFGRMGRFNFGVYRVCFKCEWGHGARRNGNYFRSRIWFSDVFSFSAGIARRTAIQPKNFLFPTQRRRPVTSVRDECDERNSFEKSDLCTTLQVPAPVWMFEPLGGKSSAQTRKSEEKNILRSLRSNKLFLQSKSPRVGWVG